MSELKGSFSGFVGIDISKDKFDACGITREETKLFQISTTMDRKGFEKLKGHLADTSVLIGMESTATYHINLFSYLVSEGYNVVLINPLLVSNYVKMQLRKTKTDKKDAAVIASFLLANGNTLMQRVPSSLIVDLRDLSRQRESLTDEMTALKMNIKRLLNITFPELEHISDVFTKSMLKLLQQYPSAFVLRDVDIGKLSQTLIADSYGHKRESFASELIKAACWRRRRRAKNGGVVPLHFGDWIKISLAAGFSKSGVSPFPGFGFVHKRCRNSGMREDSLFFTTIRPPVKR